MQKIVTLLSAVGLVMTVACAQSDPGITTAVKTRLAADDTVKAYQIDVDTAGGVVTLTGVVESPSAKDQAVVLARGTDGVKDVVDRITVNEPVAATHGSIGQDIKDATKTAGDKIGDGVDATKDFAREATDKTKDAADKTGEVVTDAAITTAVKTKLLVDDKTPGLKIDVDTKDGVVTLNGTVKSASEIEKAIAEARGTKGVKRVISHLKVAA